MDENGILLLLPMLHDAAQPWQTVLLFVFLLTFLLLASVITKAREESDDRHFWETDYWSKQINEIQKT